MDCPLISLPKYFIYNLFICVQVYVEKNLDLWNFIGFTNSSACRFLEVPALGNIMQEKYLHLVFTAFSLIIICEGIRQLELYYPLWQCRSHIALNIKIN